MLRASSAVVILCLALGLGGAALVTTLTPPQYRADVMVFIGPQVPQADASAALDTEDLAKKSMNSYEELAASVKVAEDVVGRLRLEVTPEELAKRLGATSTADTVVL